MQVRLAMGRAVSPAYECSRIFAAGKSSAGGPRGRRGRLLGRGKGRKAAAQGPLRFLGISPKIGNIALNLVGMFRPPGLGNLQG
jgi:hypothetical protein